MGRGGALVESMTFNRSCRHVGSDLGQVFNSQLPVAIRRETPSQYPCCVGSASEQKWAWRGAI